MQTDRFFPAPRAAAIVRTLIERFQVPADTAAAVLEHILVQANPGSQRRRLNPVQRFERDSKIVEMKAAGASSADIGDALGITQVHVNTILYNIRQTGGVVRPDGTIAEASVQATPRGRPVLGAEHEDRMRELFVRGLTDEEAASELGVPPGLATKIRVRLIAMGGHMPDSTTILQWRARWDKSLMLGGFKAKRLAAPQEEWNETVQGSRDAAVRDMEAHIEAHALLKAEGAALGLVAFPKRKNPNT